MKKYSKIVTVSFISVMAFISILGFYDITEPIEPTISVYKYWSMLSVIVLMAVILVAIGLEQKEKETDEQLN